jgi:hypothetical protein
MTTGATGQLGLALPVQGELSGTWGDTVNNGITQYTNIAIAGTLTLTNDGAVTLANTTGDASASNITSTLTGAGTVTAQFAIVRVTGTLTTAKVVTGPAYSKTYTVVNSATGGIVTFKASGQTGVSIAVGETAFVYFNGTDYVKIVGTATAGPAGGSNTQVQFNSSGILAGSANMTFNGTTLTVNDLTDSSLTATRIVFAGTAGNLNDSANLTWNGTSLSATQIDITAQGPLRLQDTTGGEYVGLRSPATLGASYTLTFPADDGTSGQALITDGSGVLSWSTAASGDVYGPASSTANGIALFDGTTGKIIKDSAATNGLIYGLTVGRGAGGVATNTAVGASALAANTTGSTNTAVGASALTTITTGTRNTAVGYIALINSSGATTGNTGVGYAAAANVNGNYNTAVGDSALDSTLGGSFNTAIGADSLQANTTADNNTAVGYQSLYSNTTGTGHAAVGYGALKGVTTGNNNTAVGKDSAQALTTGSSVVAVGRAALYTNTTGGLNTAIGETALYSNTTASYNTAIGYQAGYSNTTGTGIVALGRAAMFANTTGASNNAVGNVALYANTTGNYNAAFGESSLSTNTTASGNSAFGHESLTANTTGASNVAVGLQALRSNTTASNNTAVGYQAGYSNTTGTGSVSLGYQAGYTNTTGNYSTNFGYRAGYSSTTGTENCFIGGEAGYNVTTGSGNTFVGAINVGVGSSGYYMTTGSNNTIIGAYNGNQGGLDIRTASNYIVLSDGDGNPRGLFDNGGRYLIGLTASSDSTSKLQVNYGYMGGGFCVGSKTNAGNTGNAAQVALEGWLLNNGSNASANLVSEVTGGDTSGSHSILVMNRTGSNGSVLNFRRSGTSVGNISIDGSSTTYSTSSDYRLKNTITPMTGALAKVAQLKPVTYKWNIDGSNSQGFIAHELAEVVPECVTGKKDAVDAEGKPVYQGIDTSFLVATLTAAIQEQQAIIESLKARLDAANL